MKPYLRIILTALAMICVSTGAYAQLRYGFRLGGEFASASLNGAPDCRMLNKSAFSGGLDLEYQMPSCGFAPDIAVVYTRYNSRMKSEASGVMDPGRDFIAVPLHLKYKFWLKSTKELFAPMVYTGPSVMFRLGDGSSDTFKTKSVQTGWDLGIGFDIVNFIQISGGYRFGLGNAADKSDGYPEASIHTNGWNIAATILFDF